MQAKVCDNVTPLDLLEFKRRGFAVFRTAHVGNQYPSNLFLAAIGIPVSLYDRTIPGRDANYHPALEIKGGRGKRILKQDQDDLLVPYGDSEHGVSPARRHYRTFKKLFPGLVYTDSEFFLGEARDKVGELMDFVAHRHPSLFDRYVLPCGCMTTLYIDGEKCFAHGCEHSPQVKFPVTDLQGRAIQLLEELVDLVTGEGAIRKRGGGAVPSLPFLFVMELMASFWVTDKTRVFDLSGPDLVRYAFAGNFLRSLQKVWTLAANVPVAKDIPDLILEVVPTADFRFGCLDTAETTFLDVVEELFRLRGLKRNLLPPPGELGFSQTDHSLRQRSVQDVNGRIHQTKGTLGGLACDITYDIAKANFFTQHDLALSGAKLRVPEKYMAMTFREMGIEFSNLRNILHV